MGLPLPINPFQALPNIVRGAAEVANDNVEFRLPKPQLRLVTTVEEVEAVELAAAGAEGVETVAVVSETAEVAVGLVEVGAAASYALMAAPAVGLFLGGDSSPRMPKILPVVDKPPQGKDASSWLDEMTEMAKLAALMASKRNEALLHRQNGQEHLARQVEQDLETLQIQMHTNLGIHPTLGNRLEIKATAAGGDGDASGATGDAKQTKADAPPETTSLALVTPAQYTIQWNPIDRISDQNIHINGDAKTMPEWIAAADRSRYLKAGAILAVGNIPLALLVTHVGQLANIAPLFQASGLMGPLIMTVGSLFGAVYLSQGGKVTRYFHELFPSSFGTNLRHTLAQQDRPASEDFAQVMSAWYRGLTNKLRGWEKIEIWDYRDIVEMLKDSKKTVDGVEYDLLNFMDATPFFKPAEKSYHRAYMLPLFEAYGRRWTPADEYAIRSLQIQWDVGALYTGNGIKLMQWLAKKGNESVVKWVYGHARTGEAQAQAVFAQLVADQDPLALSFLEGEVNTGGISIVPKAAK